MAQEEQTQKCSSRCSGGGGSSGSGVNNIGTINRSSKKPKQRKVPQRGLGVAQLEKIRLEEQQKKDAKAPILPSPSSNTSLPPAKPLFASVSIPNYHQSNQSVPFPSPPPPTTDLPSTNSMYRPPQLVQNIDLVDTNSTVTLTNPVGWSDLTGHDNVPKLWSSWLLDREKDNPVVDPGMAFRSNELPYEFNPVWPLPESMQRAQQYQQPSSSMVHVSSASTSSSSSVLNYQMEPPSNQSYHGSFTPKWPEEEKMVGFKRPCPFSLDNQPAPLFHFKVPPVVHPISSRSDEAASCLNGGTLNFQPGTTNFRDGPSGSTSILEPGSKKSIDKNGIFHGDFLTLAPPTTLTSSSSKLKNHSTTLAFYSSGCPDFESLPYQENMEEPSLWPGSSGLNQPEQPYYSFLPPAVAHVGQSTMVKNCNGGEVGGSVDLNLKL
ncbi:hypothetical protein CFOL_v3_07558 [Cephalotus follicularis]|uniref:Uncharacterized protein n=1 Tax=Cephalotus follicularis TaxID=3775 RepID=A0A1Q3B7V0_CEPFO|nr:hypothetical protein CFOL_v3_07558 [Cephalotus follicularis]